MTRRIGRAACLCAIIACTEAPPPDVEPPAPGIEGTWRAARFSVPRDDTSRAFPLGHPPQGYLVYDRTGRVFLQLHRRTAMDSLRARHWSEIPDSVLKQLLRGTVALFGTYRVDSLNRLVTHFIEGEIPPGAGSFEIATPFRVTPDSLILGSDSMPSWVFVRARE